MVLAESLRARLLAALRPWLASDPAELRVDPGFLARSRAVARGVELDAAALNAAAGDGRSASWPATFDRAAVAEVELAASPWTAPAVDAVVRGVGVALTLRYPLGRLLQFQYSTHAVLMAQWSRRNCAEQLRHCAINYHGAVS